jgi:hypothetical protein
MTSPNLNATPSGFSKAAMKQRAGHLQRRAYSIPEFCAVYNIGRSKAYEEAKAGRLRVRKIGRASIITHDDAEEWLDNLETISSVDPAKAA